MVVDATKTNKGELLQTVPNYLEGRIEEADSLSRHSYCLLCKQHFPRNVLVRSSHTYFLVRSTHTDVLVRSSHTDVLVRSSHADVLVRSSHADVLVRSSHDDVLVRSSHTDVLAIHLMLIDVPAGTSWCLLVVQFQNLFMLMSSGNEKEPRPE